MLPEETFPLHDAAARSSFWDVGAKGPRRCAAELAQGECLRPGHRRPSRAQSCFPPKENPLGVGFGHRRPPRKAAGPREPGQPRPALPSVERRAGVENGLRCFPEQSRVGAVDCCLRRLSLCTMQLPEARFGPSVRRGLCAERPSWLRGHGWGLGIEGLRAPNSASRRRRNRGEWVSGTGDPQQSSRAQGAGAAPPRFALCSAEDRGRKRLALLS